MVKSIIENNKWREEIFDCIDFIDGDTNIWDDWILLDKKIVDIKMWKIIKFNKIQRRIE
jgi:hypothetical protein